jgi:cation:H+ antiporter
VNPLPPVVWPLQVGVLSPAETLWNLFLVLAGVGALWYGALVLVDNAVGLARRMGVTETVVGVLVVGVGTSMPEVAVTAGAALQGVPNIAVANVVGSNFFNLGIVLGAVALIRVVPVRGRVVRRDGLALLVATVFAAWLLRDLTLTVFEGALLLGGLVIYLASLLRRSGSGPVSAETEGAATDLEAAAEELDTVAGTGVDWGAVFRVLAGLGLVVFAADVLVLGASTLARALGVSEWAIGLTVVAGGTSTPEFAAAVVAAFRGRHGLSVGSLVGSSTFNVLAVLGVAGLAGPLTVADSATGSLLWLLGLVVLVLVFLRSERQLTRVEGVVLVFVAVSRWVVDIVGIDVL